MGAFDNLENFSAYVDLKGGLGRIMGNQKVFKMLLQTFVKSPYLCQIKDELQSEDFDAVAASCHAVKGMAANLSLEALQSVASKLEVECKAAAVQPETAAEFEFVWETTMSYVFAVIAEMEQRALEV